MSSANVCVTLEFIYATVLDSNMYDKYISAQVF